MNKILIRDFLSSKKFMFILGAVTVITWLFNAPMIAISIAALAVGLIYMFKAKEGALLCALFLIIAGNWSIHVNFNNVCDIISFSIAMPCILFAAFFLIKDIVINYKKYLNKIKNDFVIYALLLMVLAMFISLIAYAYNNVPNDNITSSFGYIASFLPNIAFALVALLKIDIKKGNLDNILFPFVIIIFVIFIQMMLRFGYVAYNTAEHRAFLSSDNHYSKQRISYIISDDFFTNLKEAISKKEVSLYWELCNHYVALVMMSLSMVIYLILKTKDNVTKYIAALSIPMALVIFVLSTCRASWLGLAAAIVILAYVVINNYVDNKYVTTLNIALTSCVGIAVILVGLLLVSGKIDLDLNGRDYLYDKAHEVFYKYPITGSGAGTSHFQLIDAEGGAVYNYHNLFYQPASDTGMIGLLCFMTFICAVSFRIYNNKSLFSYFVMISFAYLLAHGVADNVFFNQSIMPFLVYIIMLLPKEDKNYMTLYGYKKLTFA